MKTPIVLICLSLAVFTPQFATAGKNKGGGGGKSAHGGGGGGHGGGGHGGGGGGGRAAHMGGSGNRGMHGGGNGGGQHSLRSAQGGAGHQGGNGHHGLNSRNRAGAGLNNHHQGGNAGLNGHGGNAARHAGNNFAHAGHNRFAGHGQHWNGGHWRASHWRSSHDVFYNYRHVWHDHGWWRSHYDVVVFGGGWGPWYWDSGYWYPAWGYAPAFSFGWDVPIYSYANLPPDQVVVNVQEALQDQGYYTGNVDGQLGKLTRDALATYQQDHSLEVTAAIDEPTVQALGLSQES